MKLYAARHGQTKWNLEDKVCGRTDLHLTDLGQKQAQILAEKVGKLQIDLITVSSMLRTRQTVAVSANMWNIPVLVDQRLIEQDYGIYEGASRFDEGFLRNKRMFAYRYPEGESMMDVTAWAYSLIEDVKRQYAGKNVLLVCHGGVCRLIRTYFEDMTNEDFFHYSEENAAVREYEL